MISAGLDQLQQALFSVQQAFSASQHLLSAQQSAFSTQQAAPVKQHLPVSPQHPSVPQHSPVAQQTASGAQQAPNPQQGFVHFHAATPETPSPTRMAPTTMADFINMIMLLENLVQKSVKRWCQQAADSRRKQRRSPSRLTIEPALKKMNSPAREAG
ncbi:MAG: hypothetical protein ACKO26_24545 [Planctomycetota bacterium]